MSFLAATNVAGKNAKLLQKVFFAAKKMLLHVAAISAVAKSFARTINVAAITGVLQQQLMSLTKQVFLATINVAGITSGFLQQHLLSLSLLMFFATTIIVAGKKCVFRNEKNCFSRTINVAAITSVFRSEIVIFLLTI
ncbi:hypothetical protein QL285_044280 [Trifolium repens]|nr:hypothetical protein QL285_044280 [Trifolium repens]